MRSPPTATDDLEQRSDMDCDVATVLHAFYRESESYENEKVERCKRRDSRRASGNKEIYVFRDLK